MNMNEAIQSLLDECAYIDCCAPSPEELETHFPEDLVEITVTAKGLELFRKAYRQLCDLNTDDKFRSLRNTLKAMEVLTKQAGEIVERETGSAPAPAYNSVVMSIDSLSEEQKSILKSIVENENSSIMSFSLRDNRDLIAYIKLFSGQHDNPSKVEIFRKEWEEWLKTRLGPAFKGMVVDVKLIPFPAPKPKPNLYPRISEQQRIFADIITDKDNPVQGFGWQDDKCLIAYVNYDNPKFQYKMTKADRNNYWRIRLEKLLSQAFAGVSIKIVNTGCSFNPVKGK